MTTVLTGGKFNAIHPGHIWLLQEAKYLGDRLVVVLANDSNNKKEYAVPFEERKKNILATGLVDEVIEGDKENFYRVVEEIKPDIIVLGYDQTLPAGVEERVKGRIEIVRLEKHGDYETRKIKGGKKLL